MLSTDGKKRVLSLSYGKDSLACLEAIKQLGYPLDAIVHAEVWATDSIQADLPEMIEFKEKADKIILERYGIKVERFCAERERDRITYDKIFHTIKKRGDLKGCIYGFPSRNNNWCNGMLKMAAINRIKKECGKYISYIGIASDENDRIERHSKNKDTIMPLVDIGWDEAYCRKWCEENDLLSPLYKMSNRGGCWFCHNQTINQLRYLERNHKDLWNLLIKWENESPFYFRSDKHSLIEMEKRFKIESEEKPIKWKWDYLNNPPCKQFSLFDDN